MSATARNLAIIAASLLLVGCSGASSTELPSEPGGSSSGTSSGGGSSSGSGAMAGSSSGNDGQNDSGSGPSSGGAGSDGGDEDATVRADAGRPKGSRDASTPDSAVGDASGGATGDGGDALAAARAQCVQIINMDRATLNPPSPPLTEDTAEESCVDGQAQADNAANTAHSAFRKCGESAQDECPNWPGPPSSIMTKCLAQMWAEGPPAMGQDNHWLNMSNAKYKKVACGFYQTASGKWWATQDFY